MEGLDSRWVLNGVISGCLDGVVFVFSLALHKQIFDRAMIEIEVFVNG